MAFKMPWNSGVSAKGSGDKKDISLNDVLPTTASRIELMVLIVLCTDAMREKLNAVFEAPRNISGSVDVTKAGDRSAQTDTDGKRNNTSQGSNLSMDRDDTAYLRNLTLTSPDLQSLRTAAISDFNPWRTSILRRLGETLKVNPEAVKQAKSKYLATQQALAKAKKRQEILDQIDDNVTPGQTTDTTKQQLESTSFSTKLNDLDDKTRALILNATLFIVLSLGQYNAHSRILITHVSHSLNLPNDVLASAEASLAMTLQNSTATKQADSSTGETSSSQPQSTGSSNSRWKVGLATIAGATLIGVTGGLAAPFLLGAAGAIMGGVGLGGLATLLGATIANPVTIAALFGGLGGRMGGKAMEEFTRDIEDFEIIPITPESNYTGRLGETFDGKTNGSKTNAASQTRKPQPLPSSTSQSEPQPALSAKTTPESHLRITLGISGHVLSPSDTTSPWQTLSHTYSHPHALRYELPTLLKLGASLTSFLQSTGYTVAQASALHIALPALSAALLPISLLQVGSVIDNPFSLAMERSDKAGVVLARALVAKVQGERPVTLLGYGVGARVVHSCLLELARQHAFGIVEDAVLIGAPVPGDHAVWVKMRAMVAGRLVNAYTTDDLLLGYLYRVRYAQLSVAGLDAVRFVEGVENFDVTGLVKGHGQYRLAIGQVLKVVGLCGLDLEKIEAESKELEEQDRKERNVYEDAKAQGKLGDQEDEAGAIVLFDATEYEQEDKSEKTPIHPGPEMRHDDNSNSNSKTIVPLSSTSTSTSSNNNPKHPTHTHEPKPTRRTSKLTSHEHPYPHPASTHPGTLSTAHFDDTADVDADSDSDHEDQDQDQDSDDGNGPAQRIQMLNLDPTPDGNPDAEVKSR